MIQTASWQHGVSTKYFFTGLQRTTTYYLNSFCFYFPSFPSFSSVTLSFFHFVVSSSSIQHMCVFSFLCHFHKNLFITYFIYLKSLKNLLTFMLIRIMNKVLLLINLLQFYSYNEKIVLICALNCVIVSLFITEDLITSTKSYRCSQFSEFILL